MSGLNVKKAIAAARKAPLASRLGIAVVVGALLTMGAMCPKCGYGTRVTSKRWAKCKRCGERVLRGAPPRREGAD